MAICLFVTNLKGTSSMHLHRDLGITQRHAWHIVHRLREAWSGDNTPPFDGPTEFDEMALGEKRKWMRSAKRRELLERYGRGSVTTVVGAKDRGTGPY